MSRLLEKHYGDKPYPSSPGFKERGGTSEDAARAIESRADTLRQQVLNAIKRRPGTADEIAARIGEDILSVRPRLSELRAKNLIAATSERRANASGKMAQVWRAA